MSLMLLHRIVYHWKVGSLPNNVPSVRIMLLLEQQHNWAEGKVPRKTCQIFLPMKNGWGCSPVGADSIVLCCFGDWMIHLSNKEHIKRHISNFMFYLLKKIKSLSSRWKNQTQPEQPGPSSSCWSPAWWSHVAVGRQSYFIPVCCWLDSVVVLVTNAYSASESIPQQLKTTESIPMDE